MISLRVLTALGRRVGTVIALDGTFVLAATGIIAAALTRYLKKQA